MTVDDVIPGSIVRLSAGYISTKELLLAKPGTLTSSVVSHRMDQGEEKGVH